MDEAIHGRAGAGAAGDADSGSARVYWRSLQELAHRPEVQEYLEREFPDGASEWGAQFSRRNFLRLMGAAIALTSGGC